MSPRRTRLDPEGHYQRLGVDPAASQAEIAAAYRAKARVLHPDVPQTGNTAAFVAVKQAYDALSSAERRASYDRRAREAAEQAAWNAAQGPTGRSDAMRGHAAASRTGPGTAGPGSAGARPAKPDFRTRSKAPRPAMGRSWRPRLPHLRWVLWTGLGGILAVAVFEAIIHLAAQRPMTTTDIRPNAPVVAPLPADQERAVLYGPAPVQLPGSPNFYTVPTGTPTLLWRADPAGKRLVPVLRLPPFSSVHAVRLLRRSGFMQVLLGPGTLGFVNADHLAPGDAAAARTAYCGYNAGPAPANGELLERHGSGPGSLWLENRSLEPVVVKLRAVAPRGGQPAQAGPDEATGPVAVSVFLEAGGETRVVGLPPGTYRPDFAIGEMWSRGCDSFTAGMRTRRLTTTVRVPGDQAFVLTEDALAKGGRDIPVQLFDQR